MIIGAIIQSTATSLRAVGLRVIRVNMSQNLLDSLKRELMPAGNSKALFDTDRQLPEGAIGEYFGIPIYLHEKWSIEFEVVSNAPF